MKHLNSFENEGDFVGEYAYADTPTAEGKTRKFMQNNIGKIIQYWKPNNRFRVQYLDASINLDLNADRSWWFEADEIIYHSKDEQDCLDKLEMLKNTNKYNI